MKRPTTRRRDEFLLQQAADDYMVLEGWHPIVTDPPQLRGLGVSEKGIPDRLYIRYLSKLSAITAAARNLLGAMIYARAQVLWVEFKAPTGKVGIDQIAWHAAEEFCGGLVWVAGRDFDPNIDSFIAKYEDSGLLEKMARRQR